MAVRDLEPAAALLDLLLPADAVVVRARGTVPGAEELRRADAVIIVDPRGPGPPPVDGPGFPYHRRFAVLPDTEHPRWLIPLDSGRIAAGAFAFHAPYRRAARAKYIGARAAALLGAPLWHRHVLSLSARETPLVESWIAGTLGIPVRLGVARGAPGARPKPALIALDPAGGTVAFAKLGRNDHRRAALRREAMALDSLAARPGTVGLAPRLLGDVEVGGTYVTLQEPLGGKPGATALAGAHEVFLRALIAEGEPGSVGASAFARSVSERATGADAALLWRLTKALEGVRLPRAMVHGDFAPWNLRITRSGLRAFDWEWWCQDGLPLVDALHHQLQAGFLLESWTVQRASERLGADARTRPFRLGAPEAHAVQALAILDYVLHIAEDGYGEEPLASRYRELLARIVALAGA